ncbi:Calcium-binding EF-hand family protein [Quillaja saponaria]|uniref:Calcium-binding EF-hand family protein n=1 Tax=Quillaja saponaria TaxID=32244 RepID=A0AAD7KPW3_QUISA|nr:Calcium-binding EF-hand family protein [Quillaja saponaria]
MEQTLRNITSSGISSFLRILKYWHFKIEGFILNFLLYLQILQKTSTTVWNPISEPLKQSLELDSNQPDCDETLGREEVSMVMEKLGIEYEDDGGRVHDMGFGVCEISQLFEEEPSLEEVKEAFNVFDKNKDGFIEGRELQKILKCLGMEKDLEECRRMISKVDENGDGLIDFDEFLKFMEKSFC